MVHLFPLRSFWTAPALALACAATVRADTLLTTVSSTLWATKATQLGPIETVSITPRLLLLDGPSVNVGTAYIGQTVTVPLSQFLLDLWHSPTPPTGGLGLRIKTITVGNSNYQSSLDASHLFTDGTWAPLSHNMPVDATWIVDSNVTLDNGFSLAGTGYRLSRVDWTLDDFQGVPGFFLGETNWRTDFTVRFYGVPEPVAFSLAFTTSGLFLCRRHR